MKSRHFLIVFNIVLLSLTIGLLAHQLLVFIPQQHQLINDFEVFKNQFGTIYVNQQFTLLKIVLIPWLLELIIGIGLISKATSKFQKMNSIGNFGLFCICMVVLIVADLPLQLVLSNGYHVFAYKMSSLIHWIFLLIWNFRLVITIIQIELKTAKKEIEAT